MPPVAFLELLNSKSKRSLKQVAQALNDDRMKNVALSEHEAVRTLQIWKQVTACITVSGAAELAPAAALSQKLVYDLPDVTKYHTIWPKAVPILCEGVSACVSLLRWMGSPNLSDPTASVCQDVVAAFMEHVQSLVSGSSKFKEFCGAQMMDVLVKSVCEAGSLGSDDTGSNFSESAGCLEFCFQLLLALVTKCQKNQHALAIHPSLEALLRDVLPGAATVQAQTQFLEILARVLRKETLPRNLTPHIAPILDDLRTAISQKEMPFCDLLMKLVLTLNKHHAQSNAAARVIRPHSHARLRRAEFRSSTITAEAQERAAIMYGGATVVLFLTFIQDGGVEDDFCTLFKSDLKVVGYSAVGESNGATVTMKLGSVRSAYGTNVCLQQVAQSVAKEETELILELELSTQDAKQLVAELKGPREASQKTGPSQKRARADKKGQAEKKAPAAAVRLTEDPIEEDSQPQKPQARVKRVTVAARDPCHQPQKLDLKPVKLKPVVQKPVVHPKKPEPNNHSDLTRLAQPPSQGTRLPQNSDAINKQATTDMQGHRTPHERTAARNKGVDPLTAPAVATTLEMPPAPAQQPPKRKAPTKSTQEPRPHREEVPAQLPPSPTPDPFHPTADPISTSPPIESSQLEDAPTPVERVDAQPVPAKKAQPVQMQRRRKLNNATKAKTVANDSKENKDFNRVRNKPTAAKQDGGVKKPKATRKTGELAPQAKHTASDPIEACFDVPKMTQKQNSRHMKTGCKTEVEDMVADSPSKESPQKIHGTTVETPNTAALGRPDRKALTRNAKANVKYDNCDAPDDGNDPFQPPPPRRSNAPQRSANPAVDTSTMPQLDKSMGKGKPVKSSNKGKKSNVQAPPPVSTSKLATRKAPQPQSYDFAAGGNDDQPQELSVTVRTHASPQNLSQGSASLRIVPDTVDTAARGRAKAKSKAVPSTNLNDSDEHAPRRAGKVVPSPLTEKAVLELNKWSDQKAWHQKQAMFGNQGLPDAMAGSGGLAASMSRYSPLMAGSMGQFGMNQFGHLMPGQMSGPVPGQMFGGPRRQGTSLETLGFGGQPGFGADQESRPGPYQSSGFATQMGMPETLQHTSKVTGKNPRSSFSPFTSTEQPGVGLQGAVPQSGTSLKRSRAPHTDGKVAKQKKKSRTEKDGSGNIVKEELAEEQESKQLMQMINAMMQDEDTADDPRIMQQLKNSLSKLMKNKQQRSVNRVKKVLEEGQENIDNTITGAREEYLREEQDLDAQFRHDLDELELSMAETWMEIEKKHAEHLEAMKHDWMKFQILSQKRTNICTHHHEQVGRFREEWQAKIVGLEQHVGEELVSLEESMQKQKKKASRKKDLQAAQQMLQAMF